MMTVKAWADNVHFILVGPTEPGNIGAAARAIKNMWFRNLGLVNPVPYETREARAMACGAKDVLAAAGVYPSLDQAISDKSLVVGTTRRRGSHRGIILPMRMAAGDIARAAAKNTVAVLFGNEHTGLTNREIAACGLLATIPSDARAPSLNLAQSVMLAAYELGQVGRATPSPPLVGEREVRALMKKVRATLTTLGYGRRGSRDLRADIALNIRRLVGRAGLTDWELRMIRGLCRRIEDKAGAPAGQRPCRPRA
jgi:TrmH family RNA methyltransferase